MSISWVDVVVVILALLAAASGWRHGVAVALLSFAGVLTGAVLGLRLAPLLAGQVESQQGKVLLGIGVVVLLVALGEATGVYLGRFIRDRIRGEGTLKVDSTLGAGVQAVAVVVAAWLIALPLSSTSFSTLTSGLRDSRVLAGVDDVMPDAARKLPPSCASSSTTPASPTSSARSRGRRSPRSARRTPRSRSPRWSPRSVTGC